MQYPVGSYTSCARPPLNRSHRCSPLFHVYTECAGLSRSLQSHVLGHRRPYAPCPVVSFPTQRLAPSIVNRAPPAAPTMVAHPPPPNNWGTSLTSRTRPSASAHNARTIVRTGL